MYHKRYDNGGGLFQSSESGFLGGEPQAEKKEEVVSVSETTTPETKPETTEEVRTEQTTFLGIPIGGEKKMYGKYEVGSPEYYKHLGRKKDRKYFNPAEKWEKAYGEKVGRKKPRYNKFTNGGGMSDYSGNYYSTNDFVGSHNLQELADRIFGTGWQAEDDVNQIERLIDSMGGGYIVTVPSDRSEWQDMMEQYGDFLFNKTGDSNYDIFVISEEDFESGDYDDDDDYSNNQYLIVDNSGSISYYDLAEDFNLLIKKLKVKNPEIIIIYTEDTGGILSEIVNEIKRNERDNDFSLIILTDGQEDFSIDLPAETTIYTTSEGKLNIEEYFPNISAKILLLNDYKYKNGGGVEDNDDNEYKNGGNITSGYNYYLVTLHAEDRDYGNEKTFDIEVISDSVDGAGRKAKQIVQNEDSNYVYKKETYKLSVKNIKKLGAIKDIAKSISLSSKDKSYLADDMVITIGINGGGKYGYCKYTIAVVEYKGKYKYVVYDEEEERKIKSFNSFEDAIVFASIKVGYKLKVYDRSISAGKRAKNFYDMGGGVGEQKIKVRNLDDNKIRTWTVSELLERINQDNATDEFNYTEEDWIEGFIETLGEFYSLKDKNGKPLNDLSIFAEYNYPKPSFRKKYRDFSYSNGNIIKTSNMKIIKIDNETKKSNLARRNKLRAKKTDREKFYNDLLKIKYNGEIFYAVGYNTSRKGKSTNKKDAIRIKSIVDKYYRDKGLNVVSIITESPLPNFWVETMKEWENDDEIYVVMVNKIIPENEYDEIYEYDPSLFEDGGGIEDNFNYSSGLTDEDMVKENLVNGEISCSILREIIGCDPEYPSQIVGSIKLTKCFLRPYYKIG